MVGPPLLLGLLAALIATQVQARAWRSEAQVSFDLPNVTSFAILLGGSRTFIQVEATYARTPQLAARIIRAAGVPGLSAAQFLRHSSAKVSQADQRNLTVPAVSYIPPSILTLSVWHRRRAAARRLANAYATEFTRYTRELDMRPVQQTVDRVQARIKELRARGLAGTPAFEALVQELTKLRDVRAQLANNTSVQRADSASSFRPHVLRNGLLAGALGALLGVALAVGVAVRLRQRPLKHRGSAMRFGLSRRVLLGLVAAVAGGRIALVQPFKQMVIEILACFTPE